MKQPHACLAALACATITIGALLLQALGGKPPPEDFNVALYEMLMANRVTSTEEIVELFEFEQLQWLPIAPPSTNNFLQGEKILPFAPRGFSKDFRSGLVAVETNGITSYPIYVYEDAATRERLILNANADVLSVISQPFDYDPLWYVTETYPSVLFYDGWVTPHEELLKAIHDPARIVAKFKLMTKKEVIEYVWRVSLTLSPVVPVMKAYTGQDDPVTDIHFYEIEKASNGVMVSIVCTNSVTNLDIFVCSSLMDTPYWDLAVNTNLSTNWIEWTDTDEKNVRFYAAGNGSLDSIGDADDDGLAGGREVFMYHTSPTNSDSDSDNLTDYQEVITYNTDPNNDDTNEPTATIIFPTNGMRRVWLP